MTSSKTYGLTHLAIAVKDVKRTLVFYQQVFDMQAMYIRDGFIQLTTPGCNDIMGFEEKKDKPIGDTEVLHILAFGLKNQVIMIKLSIK
jgi:catechol 2,3-dioxygenase-like lactoylglutathione lyase family enzyme